MSADLSGPLRDAIVADASITALLPAYNASFPVFTRTPVPDDAPLPLIVISDDITKDEQDGVFDRRPVVTREVAVYGSNEMPEPYRVVERLGYLVRNLFHRQNHAIVVPDWGVVDIVATGPTPAGTGLDQRVGRVTTLTIRLAQLRTS